jgi:dTDP-4-dehydrorhamnose reductase
MKKILIIGSHGMAGHVIKKFLTETNKFLIFDIARSDQFGKVSYQMDITNFEKLKSILLDLKPDFTINCIGILNNEAENHPSKAVLVNSFLPHFLAETCQKIEKKFIHISSDCVFSGHAGNYKENDRKDGLGYYAQSKSLGEIDYGSNLTIRTSIIGPELKTNGIGLLHWFLNQTNEINGYTNVMWSGVSTIYLAKFISDILHNNDITGIIHLSNNTKISKYDILNKFKILFDRDKLIINRYDNIKIDKSVINTRFDFLNSVPTYDEMFLEMKEWILHNRDIYNYNL